MSELNSFQSLRIKPSIHIVNGPNLNLLGKREIEIYGEVSFSDYLIILKDQFPAVEIEYFQSNHEGQLIDYLQTIGFSEEVAIVFNPAAYTHTSIALADCISAITSPVIEVHISDIYQREEFRRISYIKEHVVGSVIGEGLKGYEIAVKKLLSIYTND